MDSAIEAYMVQWVYAASHLHRFPGSVYVRRHVPIFLLIGCIHDCRKYLFYLVQAGCFISGRSLDAESQFVIVRRIRVFQDVFQTF